MNKLTVIIAFIICLLCFGCKTISKTNIIVDSNDASRSINTIAVMHFNDQLLPKKGVTGTLVKTISTANAGEMLASIMSRELSGLGIYEVLSRTDIAKIINKSKVNEKELVERRDYGRLGKLLGVDSVVIGKILEFKLSSSLIYERGTVSFVAECIDTKNGDILWTIESNESAAYEDEIELASKAMRTAIEKLKKELR